MAELSHQFHGDISPKQFQVGKSIVIAAYLASRREFLEDGFQFAGIATWLAYPWRYMLHRIDPAPVSAGEERNV